MALMGSVKCLRFYVLTAFSLLLAQRRTHAEGDVGSLDGYEMDVKRKASAINRALIS